MSDRWTLQSPTPTASERGRRRQSVGAGERDLEAWHERYARQGRAYVSRRGPPVTFLASPSERTVRVRVEGRGPTDYGGVVAPSGRGVDFDAKATTSARWSLQTLERHQADHLDGVLRCGGVAFLALRSSVSCWVLPWGAVAPLWRRWWETRRRRETAERGKASLAALDCDRLGVRMSRPGDWLPVIEALEGGR